MMGQRYGGFWRRAVALIVDGFIFAVLYVIVIMLEFLLFPQSPYAKTPDMPAGLMGNLNIRFMLVHLLLVPFMAMVYSTYFHGAIGQTPGKILLKLKVIQTTGKSLTYGIAFVRWLGYFISAFFFLGFLWAAFDGRKQAWHDKIAGTKVVIIDDHNYHKYQSPHPRPGYSP